MSDPKRDLQRWLARISKHVDEQGGTAERIELFAVQNDLAPVRIANFALQSEDRSFDVDSLSDELVFSAETHCRAALHGGVIQYQALAFTPLDRREHFDSISWQLTAAGPINRSPFQPNDSMPRPTSAADGSLIAMTKGLQSMTQMLLDHLQPLMAAQREENRRQQEQIMQMQTQSAKVIELFHDMQLRMRLSEVDAEKAIMAERRKQDYHRLLMGIAPTVISRAAGALGLNAPPSAPKVPGQQQPQLQQPSMTGEQQPGQSSAEQPPQQEAVPQQLDEMREAVRDLALNLSPEELKALHEQLNGTNVQLLQIALHESHRPPTILGDGKDIVRHMVVQINRGLTQEELQCAAGVLSSDNIQRFLRIAMLGARDLADAEQELPDALRLTGK